MAGALPINHYLLRRRLLDLVASLVLRGALVAGFQHFILAPCDQSLMRLIAIWRIASISPPLLRLFLLSLQRISIYQARHEIHLLPTSMSIIGVVHHRSLQHEIAIGRCHLPRWPIGQRVAHCFRVALALQVNIIQVLLLPRLLRVLRYLPLEPERVVAWSELLVAVLNAVAEDAVEVLGVGIDVAS